MPSPIVCPLCRQSMIVGVVKTHPGSVFARSGLGVHCYFAAGEGPDQGDESLVFEHGETKDALQCTNCATVIIRGRRSDD